MVRLQIGVEASGLTFAENFPNQPGVGQRVKIVVDRGARGSRIAPVHRVENLVGSGMSVMARQEFEHGIALHRGAQRSRLKGLIELFRDLRQSLYLE
jgi:hypothetical protein